MTPAQTAPGVVREVASAVRRICDTLGGIDPETVRVEQVAHVPGSSTDPQSPVVRAAVTAFERVSGHRHEPILGNSGATDANILRMRGVPTARVGMPKVASGPSGDPLDFTAGMNLVSLGEMRRLAEVLVRTVLGLRAG